MRTVKFHGHSDDCFYMDGSIGAEPDESAAFAFRLTNDHGGLIVVGIYAPLDADTWTIGISQLDEDMEIPDWPMRWSHKGYSVVLEIDLPDSVKVETVK